MPIGAGTDVEKVSDRPLETFKCRVAGTSITTCPPRTARCMRGSLRGWVATASLAALAGAPSPSLAAMSRARQAEVFYQAQRAYEQGVQLAPTDSLQAERLLREAAAGFQALADDGIVNGYLYYNLANTHLRLKEVGRAILWYRRAQSYIPDDPRLAEGLRVARSLRRNDIPVMGSSALIHALLFWHYQTTLRARATLGILAYVIFWLGAIGATYRRHVAWRYLLAILLILWLCLAMSVAASAYASARAREGVILSDDVVVTKDPTAASSPEFQEKLHQGVEFELLERHAKWYRIRLPNGKSGWIPQDVATPI